MRSRNVQERRHDPYKLRGKLKEPTVCPQCGASYRNGRWTWDEAPSGEAKRQLCQACQRINDRYPAGELAIGGRFVAEHRDEILNLAKNIEEAERAAHPLNRIMSIDDVDDGLLITTTDIHLPRRIAEALDNAWNGELDMHYDEEGYFVRLNWRRDA
ncbi:MAG: ATPase [Gammaproteobacteria bacterium]|nr:ATPase [Gammaproteobacteria bacterium]